MRLDKLGRYEVLEELGSGPLGRVLLAHDPENDRRVAIKVLEVFRSFTPEQRTAAHDALREAFDSVWRLSHPNIVTILEVHEVEGVPCVVREYVNGTPLSRHCEHDSLLAPELAVEIVARAAEALDHAHAHGVVHGDIKPQNLLHVGDSGVKITDFRLSAVLPRRESDDELPVERLAYMSPEQLRGGELGAPSDLFSLTAVLYELLCGERAFPGDSASSVLYRIVHESPRDPATLATPPAPGLVEILLQSLAKAPEDRFTTGARLAQSLRDADLDAPPKRKLTVPAPPDVVERATPDPAAVRTEPVPSVVVPSSGAARRAAQPKSRRGAVVAVVVLALLAGAAYWLRGPLGLASVGTSEVWWETTVRTEPEGLEVAFDGIALDPASGMVRFRPEGPYGTLSVEHGCRLAQHQIQPADAGGEVVLVLDPLELRWPFDAAVRGARLTHNGTSLGTSPVEVVLDLCEGSRLSLEAPGHRPAGVEIPPGATPLEARTLLYGLTLERIPIGQLLVEEHAEIQLIFYVDGKRLASSERALELEEGSYRVRLKNEYHFIDQTRKIDVIGGQAVTLEPGSISLATLVVQAFPPNCKVSLRRPGGAWRYIDETPARRRVAPGRYEVKVELNPTGETSVQEVELVSGQNPPVRVAFRTR